MKASIFDLQQFYAREQLVIEPNGLKHCSEFRNLAKNLRLDFKLKYISPQFWEKYVSFQYQLLLKLHCTFGMCVF